MLKRMVANRVPIGASSVGGSLAVILIWIIEWASGMPVPPDVAIAFGVVLGTLIGHVTAPSKEKAEE